MFAYLSAIAMKELLHQRVWLLHSAMGFTFAVICAKSVNRRGMINFGVRTVRATSTPKTSDISEL